MFEKAIALSSPIHDLLARRWSGRAYDPARPVAPATLLSLAEAARWAPSCFGDQPWRYLFCDKTRDRAAWDKAFDCLTPGNQSWVQAAPLLAIACCDTRFAHNGKANAWCEYDTGAASLSLCLQASALGLMAHQMAGFSADALRANFALPEHCKPLAMISLGYQLAPEAIPEELREREFAARQRAALGSRFFLGAWERPLEGSGDDN